MSRAMFKYLTLNLRDPRRNLFDARGLRHENERLTRVYRKSDIKGRADARGFAGRNTRIKYGGLRFVQRVYVRFLSVLTRKRSAANGILSIRRIGFAGIDSRKKTDDVRSRLKRPGVAVDDHFCAEGVLFDGLALIKGNRNRFNGRTVVQGGFERFKRVPSMPLARTRDGHVSILIRLVRGNTKLSGRVIKTIRIGLSLNSKMAVTRAGLYLFRIAFARLLRRHLNRRTRPSSGLRGGIIESALGPRFNLSIENGNLVQSTRGGNKSFLKNTVLTLLCL